MNEKVIRKTKGKPSSSALIPLPDSTLPAQKGSRKVNCSVRLRLLNAGTHSSSAA